MKFYINNVINKHFVAIINYMKSLLKQARNIKKVNSNFLFFYNHCKILTLKKQFPVSDDDLNALFLGLVRIIKQKIEFEQPKILNMPDSYQKLLILYKNKIKECIKLKNEKICLLQQIESLKNSDNQI